MDGLEEFFLTIFGIIVVIFLIWLAILVVGYVLKGMALSRMARNAGLPSPGLAWVPFANNYLLGILCERSGISRTGRAWKFSVILPVLDLVCFFGGSTSLAFLEVFTDSLYYDWDSPMLWESLFSGIGSLIGLAFTVLMAIALYNLYCDYAPGKEALFTVLSVIFGGMAQAIILFLLRDRVPVSVQMGGYPPPGAYPQQGPAGPYPGGPYGPQWNQPPQQGGPYTTQWGQPPQQGGPYTSQWGPPSQQNTPCGGQWGQEPPGQPGSQAPHPNPQDPPSSGEGPEIK